jgi:hypothetical protein
MKKIEYQKTSYTSALLKPLFFIGALLIATYAVLKVEKLRPSDLGEYQKLFQKETVISKVHYYPVRRPSGALTAEELRYASIAWKYFENNYNPATGLVNGVEGKSSASLNDISNYIMGLISARELDVIDSLTFHARMNKLLNSMKRIPLYEGKLPNRYYHTVTLQMLDHEYNPSETGIGWSAIEIGRFFSAVHKVLHQYPQYAGAVKRITERWEIGQMVSGGYLYGVVRTPDHTLAVVQEGTLGYEEYASKGLMMAGYDVSEALVYTDFLKYVKINGREIPVDTRGTDHSSIPNYLTNEPFYLDGLEYGWDVNSRELAYRVYKAQEERYRRTGIVTATGEEVIDKEPFYIYNCVYAKGEEWSCLDPEGNEADNLRCISTKAAFAWNALFNDSYADVLLEAVKDFNDPKKGWYAGKYEKDGSINRALTAGTNGIILEALNYKKNGKLVKF